MSRNIRGISLAGLTIALVVGCAAAADGTGGPSVTSPVTASARPSSNPAASATPLASIAVTTRFDGRIAFTGTRGDEPLALFVLDGRDGTVERVTENDVDPNQDVSWSPDGRSIAFSRNVCPPDPCAVVIAIVDLANGRVRNVTQAEASLSDTDPSWSPDGRRLAFMSNRAAAGDPFHVDLFTVGVDGSEITRIPLESTFAGRPAWSRDGRWIAFERSDGVHTDLAVVHPDGTAPRSVVASPSGSTGGPAWSPDGRFLAYTVSGDTHEVSPGQFESLLEIRTVSFDGSGERALIAYPMQGESPAWSPDAASIAFIGGPRNEANQAWLIDADGSNPRLIPLTGLNLGASLAWTEVAGI